MVQVLERAFEEKVAEEKERETVEVMLLWVDGSEEGKEERRRERKRAKERGASLKDEAHRDALQAWC